MSNNCELKIETLTGEIVMISIDPFSAVGELKLEIQKISDIPPAQQRLFL